MKNVLRTGVAVLGLATVLPWLQRAHSKKPFGPDLHITPAPPVLREINCDDVPKAKRMIISCPTDDGTDKGYHETYRARARFLIDIQNAEAHPTLAPSYQIQYRTTTRAKQSDNFSPQLEQAFVRLRGEAERKNWERTEIVPSEYHLGTPSNQKVLPGYRLLTYLMVWEWEQTETRNATVQNQQKTGTRTRQQVGASVHTAYYNPQRESFDVCRGELQQTPEISPDNKTTLGSVGVSER